MNKIVEKLHDHYLSPLLVELFALFLINAETLNIEFLKSISSLLPTWLIKVILILFGIWLLVALWNRFLGRLNKIEKVHFFPPNMTLTALLDYDKRKYFDVNWNLKRVHGFGDLGNRNIEITANNVEKRIFVVSQPVCPKCEARLECKKAFLIYYKWFCPICGFAKRTFFNFDKIASRAQNRFRRDIRNEIGE